MLTAFSVANPDCLLRFGVGRGHAACTSLADLQSTIWLVLTCGLQVSILHSALTAIPAGDAFCFVVFVLIGLVYAMYVLCFQLFKVQSSPGANTFRQSSCFWPGVWSSSRQSSCNSGCLDLHQPINGFHDEGSNGLAWSSGPTLRRGARAGAAT